MEQQGPASRYARQTVFPGIGTVGQAKLAAARVAVVGCGALGTHLADMLARAGVGKLILVDRDIVEWSNLQRQSLFDEADASAGRPKALAAARRLQQVNSAMTIEPRVLDLTADEAETLAGEIDLLIDGSDSFETRYLINDACVAADVPWIYSAVVGATGATMNCHVPIRRVGTPDTFSPCLRCIWPDPTPQGTTATCDIAGVINGAVSVVTGMAATEAVKILLGDATVSLSLRTFDLWTANGGAGWSGAGLTLSDGQPSANPNPFDAIELPRDAECPCCVHHEFSWLTEETGSTTSKLCGRDTFQIRPADYAAGQATKRQVARDLPAIIDLADIVARWQTVGQVDFPDGAPFARLRLADYDLTLFPDGRALIRGVKSMGTARALYARYVGL